MRHRLGVGYNPGFERGELAFPASARYLEAGLSLLHAAPAFAGTAEFSLHLSRGPFCEAPTIQDRFVAGIARRLPARVGSIGLHLSGPRFAGMGVFGLGTPYVPGVVHEERADRFVRALQDATGRSTGCAQRPAPGRSLTWPTS